MDQVPGQKGLNIFLLPIKIRIFRNKNGYKNFVRFGPENNRSIVQDNGKLSTSPTANLDYAYKIKKRVQGVSKNIDPKANFPRNVRVCLRIKIIFNLKHTCFFIFPPSVVRPRNNLIKAFYVLGSLLWAIFFDTPSSLLPLPIKIKNF